MFLFLSRLLVHYARETCDAGMLQLKLARMDHMKIGEHCWSKSRWTENMVL